MSRTFYVSEGACRSVVVQAAQQVRKAESKGVFEEVDMLRRFGQHAYLPLFHGLAEDPDGDPHPSIT